MKQRKWIVALVLGLVAGGLNFGYNHQLTNQIRGGELIEVLVARRQLASGERLVKEALATRKVASSYVDERVVLVRQIEDVEGLVAAIDIPSGQMLQWSDFSRRNNAEPADLASLIEAGQRAVTISVDGPLSMGGMLRPGHRVDILGTFTRGDSRRDRVTTTILQNVKVLATGQNVRGNEDADGKKRYSTVSLSITIEEAEQLALASKQGTLALALRGHQDLEVVRGVPTKELEDLLKIDKGATRAKTSSKRSNVSVIERIKKR
jgi:pilus assembly protein CpaB